MLNSLLTHWHAHVRAHEQARLRAHFARALRWLERRDAPAPALRPARAMNLARLRAYAAAGDFPHNDRLIQQPCFIDAAGRRCAVAHLMIEDGYEAQAWHVARNFRYDYLPDIQTPALDDWAARSGFTRAELTRIQPSYIYDPAVAEAVRQFVWGDWTVWLLATVAGWMQGIMLVLVLVAGLLGAFNLARVRRSKRPLRWLARAAMVVSALAVFAVVLYGGLTLGAQVVGAERLQAAYHVDALLRGYDANYERLARSAPYDPHIAMFLAQFETLKAVGTPSNGGWLLWALPALALSVGVFAASRRALRRAL